MLAPIRRANQILFYALKTNALTKFSGLMFACEAKPLLFDFGRSATIANGIHSFFCPKFDAVFLDENKKITEVFPRIRPYRFITPAKKCRYLLELPPGSAEKFKLGPGIKLSF